ncbi:hypothetical protein ACTHPB_27870 [Priestia megaterium]|uniref:hypothetical protein n=1 Tax=Priestia megaterium TaxID=1404 RepID=UPI003F80D3F9
MVDVLQAIVAAAEQATQNAVVGVNGEVYAVELTDPIGFTAYLGLAFVLYAIRETDVIPLRFMPLIAIVLGVVYSGFVEYQAFNEKSIVAGLRLALLGIGSVATVKYFLDKPSNGDGNTTTAFTDRKE